MAATKRKSTAPQQRALRQAISKTLGQTARRPYKRVTSKKVVNAAKATSRATARARSTSMTNFWNSADGMALKKWRAQNGRKPLPINRRKMYKDRVARLKKWRSMKRVAKAMRTGKSYKRADAANAQDFKPKRGYSGKALASRAKRAAGRDSGASMPARAKRK